MRLFDLHCDTIEECYRQKVSLYKNRLQLSLERGKKYDSWFQFFAVWIPDEYRGRAAVNFFDQVYSCFLQELTQHQEDILLCRTAADMLTAESRRQCGAFLAVEGGAVFGGDLQQIPRLARLGVRAVTLTWNGANELGDGAGVESPSGLTEFGKAAVQEMEKNQILIDVSHAGEPMFYDVVEHTKGPLLATHSNARDICGKDLSLKEYPSRVAHNRNLTKEQFQIIRDRGGLVGLNLCPAFLSENGKACFDDILRHADYFLSLGGEKTLAFGSDFDGIQSMPKGITGIESLEELAGYFAKHGYSQGLIHDIFYQNAHRFFLSL